MFCGSSQTLLFPETLCFCCQPATSSSHHHPGAMSDVNSLFNKKKKGKKKAMDLSAVSAGSGSGSGKKSSSRTKAVKEELVDDDEWKTETKKTVVLTNGKTVEEFGKIYTEEVEYEEDLDVGTKIDIDDTRKMLQDVFQRSSAENTAAAEEEKEKPVEKEEPKVDLKSLSLEERFARASTAPRFAARGPEVKAKSREEEYPTLEAAVAKTVPAPVSKKSSKPKEKDINKTSVSNQQSENSKTEKDSPQTVFRASQETETPKPAAEDAVVKQVENSSDQVVESTKSANFVNHPPDTKVDCANEEPIKKEKDAAKKKKKRGAAFEI